MKSLIFTSFLFLPLASQADIIQCTFTEPFVNSTYNTATSTLSYKSADGFSAGFANVSLQAKSGGVFELISQGGKVLQTLTRDFQGSDGMSDKKYSFSVVDHTDMTANGSGGCEATH